MGRGKSVGAQPVAVKPFRWVPDQTRTKPETEVDAYPGIPMIPLPVTNSATQREALDGANEITRRTCALTDASPAAL